MHAALEEVDDAVQRGDALLLHRTLQDPALSLPHLQRDDLQLCLEQLRVQRQQKALVGARSGGARVGGLWVELRGSQCFLHP